MLQTINDILLNFDKNVHYGTASWAKKSEPWNYIVYGRSNATPSENKTGYTDRFFVAIIREEFVPEELPEQIIDAITAIPGVRLDSSGVEYDYTRKPNTDVTIEIARITFYRARKRGCRWQG